MRRGILAAGAAALLSSFGAAAPGHAVGLGPVDDARVEQERLLGAADAAERTRDLLLFTRQLSAGSAITGSLADSLAAVGVPPATALAGLRALATGVDLDRDVATGDRFHIRYEQTYTLAGDPVEVGKVLWLEVKTAARGTVAIHRFKPKDGSAQFWLADGRAAALPMMRPPLDVMTVTSGFGLRADPLDHPSSNATPAVVEVKAPPPMPAVAPTETGPSQQELRAANRAYAGFDTGSLGGVRVGGGSSEIDRIMATRRVRAQEAEERKREEEVAAARAAEAAAAKAAQEESKKQALALAAPPPKPPRRLFMHEGLDLLANTGTPVYAAADGTVTSLGPNGGYGNFIRLSHPDRLSTIYGHLSGFAPGLQPGQPVVRGEVIGFVGSTGRSTGAHLHFEIQAAGRPADPASHAAMRSPQLAGPDLAAFKKLMAAQIAERERESQL
jgi:murein DD-endopeptidase MepM/ murein hydrolase activator NlpD